MLPIADVTFPPTFLRANTPEPGPDHRGSDKVVRLVLPFSGKPKRVLVNSTAKNNGIKDISNEIQEDYLPVAIVFHCQ